MKNKWLQRKEFRDLLKIAQDKYQTDPNELNELEWFVLSQQTWVPKNETSN